MASCFGRANNIDNPRIIDGRILNYALKLKQLGRTQETIKSQIQVLKQFAKQTDITQPEQVQNLLAELKWKNSTKNKAIRIYSQYLKFLGKQWDKPEYAKTREIAFIPTEKEIDMLITGTRRGKTAILLQLLKETAARLGEAAKLKWTNLDTKRKTIYIEAEKGSNSRILPISDTLLAMLNTLPKKQETIFASSKESLRRVFEVSRNRIAKRSKKPRLQKIHLHTLRHWKATMEYHKTKDIIHVKKFLGHRSIESTMVYINIEQALWLQSTDTWTCKVAHSEQEARRLIEAGFTYVNNLGDQCALYKKLK